uniref:Putative ABC transporter ATP-binding protein LJ_1704 n=1 Tax=Anthurium amnicola TaxID=1678845 RepID=A0A1D1ZJT9_9ARAE
MGNAVAIGRSSGRRSSLVLQCSRGLLSSCSTTFTDESSSFVANPRLYSRQLLAYSYSSTAARRSCSSAAQPSTAEVASAVGEGAAAATRCPPSASLSKPPRKYARDRNSIEIKEQSSRTMVGGAQMVPVTQFVEVMEKAMGNALAKLESGIAEALVDKLTQKEAMEKFGRGMEELKNKFGEMDTKLEELTLLAGNPFMDSADLEKSVEYCRARKEAYKRRIEGRRMWQKRLEAYFKRKPRVCKRI